MSGQTVSITIEASIPNANGIRRIPSSCHPKQSYPSPTPASPPSPSGSSRARSSTSEEHEQAQSPAAAAADGSPGASLWLRGWRLVREYEWVQVRHTGTVLALAVALCLPMLAVQTALKNLGDYYERQPRPDLDSLNRTLPDLLLNLWQPHQTRLVNLVWAFELTCVAVLLALHPRRWLVLRRLFIQIALMYFLRGLTIAVTLLPRIEATCVNKPVSTVWEFLVDMVENIANNADICYGFIFSGHTGTAMLFGSIYVLYSPYFATRLLGFAMGAATVFFISFDRLHYTVDIILGIIITGFILLSYHLLARVYELDHTLRVEQLRHRPAHPCLAALVGAVRWVDARHLERLNFERQPLVSAASVSS